MAKQYQYATRLEIVSGGYPGEGVGVEPNDDSWKTTSDASGSVTASYFYRDSNSYSDNDSTRVVITVQDNWVASINSRNQLTITVTTTVQSIKRDDKRGGISTGTAHLWLKREQDGAVLWTSANDLIYVAHDILTTPLQIDAYTFTLEPGQEATRSSLWYRSTTNPHENLPWPNEYTDILNLGVSFKNILPPDYRPGASRQGDGAWLSHNHERGACHIYNGTNWTELRTVGGVDGDKGNPPLILTANNANGWRNQKLLGKDG